MLNPFVPPLSGFPSGGKEMDKGNIRENVGFIIIASGKKEANLEVVLGFNPATKQYVTWHCINGNNYYYGHYGYDFFKAVVDFRRRLKGE